MAGLERHLPRKGQKNTKTNITTNLSNASTDSEGEVTIGKLKWPAPKPKPSAMSSLPLQASDSSPTPFSIGKLTWNINRGHPKALPSATMTKSSPHEHTIELPVRSGCHSSDETHSPLMSKSPSFLAVTSNGLSETSFSSDELIASEPDEILSLDERFSRNRATRLVCMVRKSSLGYSENRNHWHEKLAPHASGLRDVWLKEYHYDSASHNEADCRCDIEFIQITLAGISSNENLLTSTNGQVMELRQALHTEKDVVLCSLGYDGAFSNLKGYGDLIKALTASEVSFCHFTWLAQDNHWMATSYEILEALDPEGISSGRLRTFFKDVQKVAVNKTLQAFAARANRGIMGIQRNAIIPVAQASVTFPKRSRDENLVEYSADAKSARIAAGHQKRRLDFVEISRVDDQHQCPCCNVNARINTSDACKKSTREGSKRET